MRSCWCDWVFKVLLFIDDPDGYGNPERFPVELLKRTDENTLVFALLSGVVLLNGLARRGS